MRMRLDSFVASRGVKHFMITEDVGQNNTETKCYLSDYNGVIGTNNTEVTTEGQLVSISYFNRDYSVRNERNPANDYVVDAIEVSGNLEMRLTTAPIQGMGQFGDYAFVMTKTTTDGGEYLVNANSYVDRDDRFNWTKQHHQITMYAPESISGYVTSDTDVQNGQDDMDIVNIPITRLSNTLRDEFEDIDYHGSIDGTSMPFNYLLETPLNYNTVIYDGDITYVKRDCDRCKGVNNIDPLDVKLSGFCANTSEDTDWDDLASQMYGSLGEVGTITWDNSKHDPMYVERLIEGRRHIVNTNATFSNPFHLKNIYNSDWNIDLPLDVAPFGVDGLRVYESVGKAQENMWLSYKYIKADSKVKDYENVERVHGLYKFKSSSGHKSNIYSLNIRNSGLNLAMEDGVVKDELREIVKKSINATIKKIAPAHTQLWKIIYTGR